MAEAERERIGRQLEAAGAGWMTPDQGLEALGRVVREDSGSVAVGVVDWSRPTPQGGEPPAFLAELVSGGDEADAPADVVLRLRQVESEAERRALLLEFVGQEARSVLRLSSAPAPEVGFFELGMDSLTAVELRNRLNRALVRGVCRWFRTRWCSTTRRSRS